MTGEPISDQIGPVKVYARELMNLKQETRHVVSIPDGTAAYGMGYRYTTVTDNELDLYTEHGAAVVATFKYEEPT